MEFLFTICIGLSSNVDSIDLNHSKCLLRIYKFLKIAIAGASTMGASIAQTFALFAIDVTVYDVFVDVFDESSTQHSTD